MSASNSTEERVLAPRFQFMSRMLDAGLAIGVFLILALLVIRISPEWMDYFIAANLSLSFAVLLSSLFVSEPVKFPSFPSLLLLTTLFRLGLNISSTRLILLEQNAGDIIYTFGQTVVGGNFVVGGVVFILITTVQFIVVAKGAERVAEVSARFAVDALPGKQMAIDADLQRGDIRAEEARVRRDALERESRLFGAMEGAMKFVKGDAIAGIIISIVNILGGLVIGVTQHGMSAGEAAETYAVLTIGDGLVSQIPALLISISAGFVITRVKSAENAEEDSGPASLAADLFSQVFSNRFGLMIAGVGVASMGLFVGFSPVPFLACGGLLLLVGFTRPDAPAQDLPGIEESTDGTGPKAEEALAALPRSALYEPKPVVLLLGKSLHKQLDIEALRVQMGEVRKEMSRNLGFTVPSIVIQEGAKEHFGYNLLFYKTPVSHGILDASRVYFVQFRRRENENSVSAVQSIPKDELLQATGTGIPRIQNRIRSTPTNYESQLQEDDSLLILSVHAILETQVRRALRIRAHMLFGSQELKQVFESMDEKTSAELLATFTPPFYSIPILTEIFSRLLAEQVPICNVRRILEAIGKCDIKAPLERKLEAIRIDLGRIIVSSFVDDQAVFRYYALSEEFEEVVLRSADADASVNQGRTELLAALDSALSPITYFGMPAVVVVRNREARPLLRRMIATSFPEVAVLSSDELRQYSDSEISIWLLGVVKPPQSFADAEFAREGEPGDVEE